MYSVIEIIGHLYRMRVTLDSPSNISRVRIKVNGKKLWNQNFKQILVIFSLMVTIILETKHDKFSLFDS